MKAENDGIIAYIKILTYYKGLQSGQIVPLAGLFGRGSAVIWPMCYFEAKSLCYGRVSFRAS